MEYSLLKLLFEEPISLLTDIECAVISVIEI